MTTTNYQSSKETTNFARICRLVINVIPDLLRYLLNTRLPASGLSALLTTQKSKFFPVLRNHQKNILYPQGWVYQGSVKDLDTSLLYILLRNIRNIQPHQNGWGNTPDIADRSLSANIDRLREQRNEAFAHAPNAYLSDGNFQACWGIIRRSIKEIQISELNTGRFVVAVDDILTMEMDHRMTNKYIGELLLDMKDVSAMEEDVGAVKEDASAMKEEVGAMKEDISAMKQDVGAMKEDVGTMKKDVGTMKEDVGAMKEDVNAMKEDVSTVMKDVSSLRDTLSTGTSHIIETTKSTVRDQTSRPDIISIQALEDAKEVIRKNGVVIIKGASGDGKTMMCYQLLKWLMDGDNKDTGLSKDPLQLHNMSKWDDIVLPGAQTQIALFIDDVSGDILEELKRRKSSIKSVFSGKLDIQSNCLILNVRDEVFKSADMTSHKLFSKDNIIDLRGINLMTSEEKLQILEKYVPEIKDLSGGKESEIVKLAPKIGFPQCCRLYRDVPSLRNEQLDFFKNPVYFMEKTLKKLPKECFASLLFLFLNDGRVKKRDLEPNRENVDKEKLDIAFHDIELSYEDKIKSLRRSLDEMLGSQVAKPKYSCLCDDDDVFYKFCHDSVQDTVALLYGNDTKIGFIKNCPRNFLPYISTSKNMPYRIVISSSNEHMYKRLVREFDFVFSNNSDPESRWFYSEYHSITSLDVWTDYQFLQGFIRWLSGQNVDKNLCHVIKLCLLNKVCSLSSEECALFLLSKGVKPDKETPFCVVEGGSKKVLEKIVEYLNEEIKLPLLNKACSSGAEECALFLLSEGVKPDKETPFYVVQRGSVKMFGKLLEYDTIATARARVSQSFHLVYNINVLQEACLCEREEMVTILYDTYPNLVHDTVDWGRSTLHLVAQTGNCDIFKTVERIILKSLYRVEDEQHMCERVEGRVVHRSCVCAQYMCQLVDDWKRTVLHESCEWGCREICKYLCESYPALASVVDKNERTVLHVSCREGHREVCKYLCESNPALATVVSKDGRTALHESCIGGHREVCKYLCESNPALITVLDKKGRTLLHVSCMHRQREICKYLCESYPALITIADHNGKTVLHLSCIHGHTEICKYFCESYPALASVTDKNGRTVLHVSCVGGRREICKHLCKSYPALTTAIDHDGRHCLHYIARSLWPGVDMFTECETHVKQYLESTGGKYDITSVLDNDGKSVLDVAKGQAKEEEERAKYHGIKSNSLYDHLVGLFGQEKH